LVKKFYWFVPLILGLFFVFSSQAVIQAAPSSQQTSIEVVRDEVWLDFPESADFHLQATSDSTIVSAELRYGVEGLSCGEVTAVTPLTFAPTTNLDLTWRWPIIESQLVPPGSKIWWQWQLETADNQQTLTPKQTITYLDSGFGPARRALILLIVQQQHARFADEMHTDFLLLVGVDEDPVTVAFPRQRADGLLVRGGSEGEPEALPELRIGPRRQMVRRAPLDERVDHPEEHQKADREGAATQPVHGRAHA
jgi:hypothetical protein